MKNDCCRDDDPECDYSPMARAGDSRADS